MAMLGHREACATPSKSLGKPHFGSPPRHAGGRRTVLPMRRIARDDPPTRRGAAAISMGYYLCRLVSGPGLNPGQAPGGRS